MNARLIQKKLYISLSPIHGFGVFTDEVIQPNDIVEECYALITTDTIEPLHDFVFSAGQKCAILTGFGSIYNHATLANVTYYYDELRNLMVFKATKLIAVGEELCIYYGDEWFSSRNAPVKSMSLWRKSWRFLKKAPLRASVIIGGIYFMIYMLQHLAK